MKKFIMCIVFAGSVFSYAAIPEFVSTDPSKRNIVIEESTGIFCPHCPEGAAVINGLMDKYGDRVMAAALHGAPMFSNPDMTSPAGDSILTWMDFRNAAPGAYINRAQPNVLGHLQWAAVADSLLNTDSPVNVAAKSTIDFATRKLTINVEVYYTADGVGTSNRLSVAIAQNDMIHNQEGMGGNLKYVIGRDTPQYRHMHILRDIKPQYDGEEISPVTKGSFIKKTYVIDLPETMGNSKLPVQLEDLEVFVFVSQTLRNIETAAKSSIARVNNVPDFGRILNCSNFHPLTSKNAGGLSVTFKNNGTTPISSLEFCAHIGNTEKTFKWNCKTLSTNTIDTILLDGFEIPLDSNISTHIQLTKVNGNTVISPTDSLILFKKIFTTSGSNIFHFVADSRASQNSFKIFNNAGEVVLQGGGDWTDLPDSGITEYLFTFNPAKKGFYRIESYDTYVDGICCRYGNGYLKMHKVSDQSEIFKIDNFISQLAEQIVYVESAVGVVTVQGDAAIAIYPNPVQNILYLTGTDISNYRIEIYSTISAKIFEGMAQKQIDISGINAGIYFLKLSDSKSNQIIKFIKH